MNYFNREDTANKSECFKIRQIPHLVSPEKISQLNFSHNEIRIIPFQITSAVNLQMLDLSHNKISKIQHICHITSLKFINLSHNLITQLPQDAVNLVEVQNIDLSFNKIKIMSSIKVIKALFQLRMLEYKGFLEINLEGNEVLKKKGCKELYYKWKNPLNEEGNRSLIKMNNDSINRTKKRNAKSVQLPFKQKESELIQTNRTVLIPQHSKLITSFKIGNDNLLVKNNEVSLKPQQMTQKFKLPINCTHSQELPTPTELQTLNSKETNLNQQLFKAFNLKDISVLEQDRLDNSNLNDFFQSCIEKLKNLEKAFRLIVDNDDFRAIQIKVQHKLTEESLLAQQLSNITMQTIRSELNDSFSKEAEVIYRERVGKITEKVRLIHKQLISFFSEKQNLPIKFYKPWVLHYRKLKSLLATIAIKIGLHKQNVVRQKQIQQLIDISPQKSGLVAANQAKYENSKSSAKQKQFDRLNELLFSRGNDQCLLLSDGKRSNSQKKTSKLQKQDEQCDSCLMMKWQSNKYKQELNQLSEQVKVLSKQKETQSKRIKDLEMFKQKYLNLQVKQKLIIEELEVIQPSTYQNMLLQQAKTIEYMLAIQPLLQADDNILNNRFRSKELFPTSVCTEKHQLGLNTRLSSNKEAKSNSHEWKNKVSEFTVEINNEKSVENEGRTSSYFKNKNVITIVNKTTENQGSESNVNHNVSLNKYQNEDKDRHKVVVSQFNSEANSFSNSDNKQNDRSKSIQKKKAMEIVQRKLTHKQSVNSKKHKTSSDVILISQNSETKYQNASKMPKKIERNNGQQHFTSQQIQQLNSKHYLAEFNKKSISNPKNTQPEQTHQANLQSGYQNANKFGGKINLKGPTQPKKRRQSSSKNKQNKQRSNSASRLNQKYSLKDALDISKYKDHNYTPIQSSEADNYKKYMQYHLRNNIIEILSKKGNLMPEAYDKKLIYLTKSQKLIHKRAESSRSQIQQTTERQSSTTKVINKTLR